jgi:hypothetical protein
VVDDLFEAEHVGQSLQQDLMLPLRWEERR